MRRRRVIRRTMGKDPIKKSVTLLANIGSGSPITAFEVISVPDRNAGGTTLSIRDGQDTSSKANVGDIVKYVNFTIQAANRDINVEPADAGWLEWAIVMNKETTAALAVTNIGTKTLGDVSTQTQRGNSLLTGAIPVGSIQPVVQQISIKIPKTMVKLQLGSALQLFCYFRSTDSADIRTDSTRIVLSALYKLYV